MGRKRLVIAFAITLLASAAWADGSLAGKTIEGKLGNVRCPEGNAELQILDKAVSKTWLGCQINAPLCDAICMTPAKKVQQQFAGKTLQIKIGESQKLPTGHFAHYIETVTVK